MDGASEPSVSADALVIDLSGKPKRATRTATRARKKQQAASRAVAAATNPEDADEDHPALGALNRHLNMMMQQLATAHRVIGRVAAERDALRQQLADLQGIPVEEIQVTAIGGATDQPAKSSQPQPNEPPPKSAISRLNYFGGDDIALMRKRRQKLVLGIVAFIVLLWLTARLGVWSLPDRLSRESLSDLPYIGDFMAIFLAGWLFFRVIRVSSKGVRWVFPSEDAKRRRR
ncbi:MAG: hypothetical protein ACRDJC_20975 [Thermomicrobiales bacterium]